MDIKVLPYVIFLVVPVLGRMSDSDDDIRSTATNTFASLVKMVPLEVKAFGISFYSSAHQIRLVCQARPGSQKNCSNVEKQSANSSRSYLTASRLSNTISLFLSKRNFENINKMASTGWRFWPNTNYTAFSATVGNIFTSCSIVYLI